MATGHDSPAAPRVPWPDLVMPVDPSSFPYQEGSRPPLHLDHLVPGDLPQTCPASLDLNLRTWACRKAWASKGPNAFLSAPKASSKGPVTKLVSSARALAPLGHSHRPGPGKQRSGLRALPGSW